MIGSPVPPAVMTQNAAFPAEPAGAATDTRTGRAPAGVVAAGRSPNGARLRLRLRRRVGNRFGPGKLARLLALLFLGDGGERPRTARTEQRARRQRLGLIGGLSADDGREQRAWRRRRGVAERNRPAEADRQNGLRRRPR